jgi:membrane protein implicated in regulation of membrane protease activity
VAAGLYGVLLLWQSASWPVLINIAIWAAAGVILHDFVFAPLCVAMGFAGRRLLPRTWWAPAAVGALCSVVLVLLAVPVYNRPGARPDNPTVLDRDYHQGLWTLLGLTWTIVVLAIITSAVRRRRRGLSPET